MFYFVNLYKVKKRITPSDNSLNTMYEINHINSIPMYKVNVKNYDVIEIILDELAYKNNIK